VWPKLDVTPISLTFTPTSPPPGTTFQATARVNSIGQVGSSIATWSLREGAAVLASGALNPIPNGDFLDVATTIGPLPLGDHTLTFVADAANDLVETNENDNSFSNTVSVGGLMAAYSFDEGTGSVVNDISGHDLDGSLMGPTWTPTGKYGAALTFNGSSAYVDLNDPTALQLTGSMTLSAWVRATANPADDGQIIAKADNTTGWQFKTSPDTGPHTFGITIHSPTGSTAARYSNTVRSLNTWYHVAGVFNAAVPALDLYVNGVLDNGVLSGAIPTSQQNSSQEVSVGRRIGGYYFQGNIDEIRIYNRALNQSEIQNDMNTPVASIPLSADDIPPAGFALERAFPNPFGVSTAVRFTLPRQSAVRVQVFNVFGQVVATLVDGERAAGRHTVSFTPRNLPSGVYLCRIQAGSFTASTKLLLIR
jgi:hypothetical protein